MSNGQYPILRNRPLELPSKSWIQFRVLTMDWQPPSDPAKPPVTPGGPCFSIHNPNLDTDQIAIEDFAVKYRSILIGAHGLTTPWDIDVAQFGTEGRNPPRFLVLLLDNAISWRFTPGGRGVTKKAKSIKEDVGLHFVDEHGVIKIADSEGAPDNCRMLFWSVVGRPRAAGLRSAQRRGYNFHIDLIDPIKKKPLPTIFDPNVPDNGGASIP